MPIHPPRKKTSANTRAFAIGSCISLLICPAWAEPGLIGQSGLIAMPDGRIDPDQSWRIGLSLASPYTTFWSSVTALPWLEVSGRVTRIGGVPGFPNTPFVSTYGDYKDKTFDVKLRVAEESGFAPALSLGMQDLLGTGIFRAGFVAASKRIGDADLTLGMGNGRIDGLFAGLRYSPSWLANTSLLAEYDATDFRRDHEAKLSGVDQRSKDVNLGLEYRWGNYLAQVSRQHGETSFSAHLRIPLGEKDVVPKRDEPDPPIPVTPRPGEADWRADPAHRRRLVEALLGQDFRDIHLAYEHRRLDVSLTNLRISRMSRAVGRAARILVAFSPRETSEIKITYLKQDQALASYTFVDPERLQDYFSGLLTRRSLAGTVRIEFARPIPSDTVEEEQELLRAMDDQRGPLRLMDDQSGDFLAVESGDPFLRQLRITPKLSLYVNDPSGAFRYDLHALASYRQRLGKGRHLSGALRLTLSENISKVTTQSNSLLPHVRSDVAEYKRGADAKLDHLVLNQYWQPRQRGFARASIGLYDEMFGGAGGQVLYLPDRGNWAADLSLDWLKQRDFQGTGFRDYSTVTAIGSLHYRLPKYGLTLTARAGRFLARDEGVRFEVKRRFGSGIELGGWYTVTNGHDTTLPGSPDAPYHDKGIFLSIPLGLVLTKDTQNVANYSLSPWTRDVGQMVASPGDLYDLVEKPLMLDLRDFDGLQEFGDVNDDYRLPDLGDGTPQWDRLGRFASDGAARIGDLLGDRAVLAGMGLTLLSSSLDHVGDRFARSHAEETVFRQARKAGKGLALLSWAGSGTFAALDDDPRLTRTAYSAFQAGAGSLAVSEALRYAIGRDRPMDGAGNGRFHAFDTGNFSRSAFPSTYNALIWATLTPYAKEYDMDWLYGAAALTSLALSTGRDHWISDSVGGAALGYLLGDLVWRGDRASEEQPRFWLGAEGIGLSWTTR